MVKRYRMVAAAALFLAVLCRSAPVHAADYTLSDVSRTSEGTIVDAKGNPVTGTLRHLYDDGTPKEVTPLVNGKPEGLEKRYYPGGKLEWDAPFAAGLLHGAVTHYYENGRTESVFTYVQGVENGLVRLYNDKGTLVSEGVKKNGLWHGEVKEYSDLGSLRQATAFRDGKREGPTRIYSIATGKVLQETPYTNDVPHGREMRWFPNGSIESEIPYVDGERHGVMRRYYMDGKTRSTATFDKGKTQGTVKSYHPSGKIYGEIEFVDGQPRTATLYSEQGKVIDKRVYSRGEWQKEMQARGVAPGKP